MQAGIWIPGVTGLRNRKVAPTLPIFLPPFLSLITELGSSETGTPNDL